MVSRVYVIGLGMGNPATLTGEAREALAASELIVGAPRLIEALAWLDVPKLSLVGARKIADALASADARTASVVMSGDVGFYSGATGLYELLGDADVQVVPGMSSLAYLCARLKTTWQDAHVVSAHGRPHNAAGAVHAHAKTFVLTGGAASPQGICAQLVERGLGDVQVIVGERLSYPDERIVRGTAEELAVQAFAPLSVMLVINNRPVAPTTFGPHLPDDAFVRGDVPMTKEEVRELALCKLRIRRDDTVWDVGAGTGSVSVEAARAACEGLVIAIEQNERACELLHRNRDAFGLGNLRIIMGEAPDALAGLPAPDRVFIGGTSGRLEQIVEAAVHANPAVRLCVTAISLETLAQILSCARDLNLVNLDLVQVTVARSREIGSHHLMMGANPVYIACADGPEWAPGTEGA